MDDDRIITEQPGESPKPPSWDYDCWGKDQYGNIYHELYRKWWPLALGYRLSDIELECFLEGRTVERGGLGKYQHAKNAVDLLWNHDPKNPGFIWTPEAEKMTMEACRNKYLGICGASSCGKSHWAGMWALLNFYAAPTKTMVLVTSTSITAAKQRVWGSVQNLWNKLPVYYRKMSKMVGSNGILRYNEVDDDKAQTDTRGITLVAAEAKQDKDAVQKLIGRKQERMFLLLDEHADISKSTNTAAKSNLVNNPEFQCVSMANPKDYFDAFGEFCKPLEGWSSINETSMEWKIRNGKVIRFDALLSTNYVSGVQKYSFQPSRETIEEAREEFGENSMAFYRMYRGFFPPQGATDSIYNSIDLMACPQNRPEWGKTPTQRCAGLDVSFTSGGDKTILTILEVGYDKDGRHVVDFIKAETLKENIMLKDETRTLQICTQVKDLLERHNVPFRNLAYDSTGGGAPFGDALALVLGSRELLPVQFSGKASERCGRGTDRRPAHERYNDKMSEIWYQGVEFVRGKQLHRLPDDVMSQMTQRTYRLGARGRVVVLPKSEMKLTAGRSPDASESFFLAIEAACARLHLASSERGAYVMKDDDYFEMVRGLDVATLSAHGQLDWVPSAA